LNDVKPMLAILMLIILSIASAVLTYLIVLHHVIAGPSSIKIERVDGEAVYVRNVGYTTIRLITMHVLDSSDTIVYSKKLRVELEPGALAVIYLQLPSSTYKIKIVTDQGFETTANYISKA